MLCISGAYVHATSVDKITTNKPVIAVNRPLIWAIQENNLDKVTSLLHNGANINNQDYLGYSPLHYAAKYAKPSIVARLVERQPLLNQISIKNGHTPLLLAVERGHKKIVSILLAAGANPNITSHKGYNALQLAIQQNNKGLVQLLLQAGATCNVYPSPLLAAIKGGSLPIVRLLLQQKETIETKDENGYSELHWATKQNIVAIFQTLVASGRFNINAKANKGATPLHVIAANKKNKLVNILINTPSLAPNIQDCTGSTPLHYAVIAKHLKTVSSLLRCAAIDVNVQNNLGNTPLHYAIQHGYIAIIKKLLARSGRGIIEIKNKKQLTPLELAMHQNNAKVHKLMLAHASLLGLD